MKTLHIPADWLPDSSAHRMVLHWTAGTLHPSPVDLEHYHFLIDGNGVLHPGNELISANDITFDGRYAYHTRGANTRCIGLAVCGMEGARQRPFSPGPAPISHEQTLALVKVTAQIAVHYGIPIAEIVTHGEVEKRWGIGQHGAWDLQRLPYDFSDHEEWFPGATVPMILRTLIDQEIRTLVGIRAYREGPGAARVASGKSDDATGGDQQLG